MIYKDDLISLGFNVKNECGHSYLEYPLDLNLKLTSYFEEDEHYPLNVEFDPPLIDVCFTEEKDIKQLIQLIKRNSN